MKAAKLTRYESFFRLAERYYGAMEQQVLRFRIVAPLGAPSSSALRREDSLRASAGLLVRNDRFDSLLFAVCGRFGVDPK